MIKSIYMGLLETILFTGFNFLIFTGSFSDDQVEEVISRTANISILKSGKAIFDLMEEASREDPLGLSQKIEKDRLFELYKKYTTLYIRELCHRAIWRKSLATKVSEKILKEFFRKLSWKYRCLGLDFSPEVPST
jgi:hypothetical protein